MEEIKSEQSNDSVSDKLIKNSIAAIMGAIELHNKPMFSYRYEITIILTINAWELALKSYLLKFRREIKVIEDGRSKEFPNCVNSVYEHIGKDFMIAKESIDLIYKYRCDVIHFYNEDIDIILYSLLRPNILLFFNFVHTYFKIDLSNQENLIILPIGFKEFLSPLEVISQTINKGEGVVTEFAKSVLNSAKKLSENGIPDGLLCNCKVYLESVNNIKHADFIIGITKDPEQAQFQVNKMVKLATFTNDDNAPKYKIDEESLFKSKFIINHYKFIQTLRDEIPGFKETAINKKIIQNEIKTDANCFKERYLDLSNPKSGKKGFYSETAINKAKTLFK